MTNSIDTMTCPHCEGQFLTARCQKHTCGHCTQCLQKPPSVMFLLVNCPGVEIDYDLDRTVPRCKQCNLIATYNKTVEPIISAPGAKSARMIEKDIDRALELMDDGMLDQATRTRLREALPAMEQKLWEAKRAGEKKHEEIWNKHWGIWGKGKFEIENPPRPLGTNSPTILGIGFKAI
ncbi:hypothetical protein B0J14DRAFT_694013 [Halenospora varia]|nr:hypothetical protein B0J14DRAFT_694013 [Halenospora varia]